MGDKHSRYNSIKRCKPLLGTYVQVTISADADKQQLIDFSNDVFAKIHDIETMMSFYNTESELSSINRSAYKRPYKISKEMLDVLSLSLELSQRSNGAFDISVAPQLIQRGLLPDHGFSYDQTANWSNIHLDGDTVFFDKPVVIELGGIAKGYAVDYAFESIKDLVLDISINAGGDIRMKNWEGSDVAIKCSDAKGVQSVKKHPMLNTAIATSANYYNNKGGAAIVEPKSQSPMRDKRSISVFAESCLLADALTKVAFLAHESSVMSAFNAVAVSLDDQGQFTIV